jgi:hypothetical protein
LNLFSESADTTPVDDAEWSTYIKTIGSPNPNPNPPSPSSQSSPQSTDATEAGDDFMGTGLTQMQLGGIAGGVGLLAVVAIMSN